MDKENVAYIHKGILFRHNKIKLYYLPENEWKQRSSLVKKARLREKDATWFPACVKPRLCVINIYININLWDTKILRGQEEDETIKEWENIMRYGKHCQISN